MRVASFFSGIGGLDFAADILGKEVLILIS
jgi:hypothetical protein